MENALEMDGIKNNEPMISGTEEVYYEISSKLGNVWICRC